MRKFTVSVNGKSYEVEVEETTGGASAPAVTPVAAPAAAPAPVAAAAPIGGTPVKAPMPGLVLRYSVGDGTLVKKNDKIIVIEAMKMETDILASADGKVTFAVKKGDSVETGTVLATIQ